MTHPIQGVDHVFLLVNDLDLSAQHYRKLGFTLSPRGLHSAAKGTANYTIILNDDYLELLGIVEPTPGNQHQRDMLTGDGEGLRAIACRIQDAYAARDALAELGIEADPVGEFSRPLPLPDGSEGVAAFAVTHFAPRETPTGFVFMCQHKTRDMVWRPELKSHANGAQAIAAIVAISADTATMAQGFARLYAAGAVSEIAGGHAVATGPNSAQILVLTPQAAAARYSAQAIQATPKKGFAVLRLAVADLAATRKVLAANGVEVQETTDGALWVAPDDASGSILEFVAS